jgi:hypothetical protein
VKQETQASQPKRKATRRSRRSLVWRIEECHLLIDRELAAGTERPARLTLLKAKLESLMELLKREDAATQNATVPPDTTGKQESSVADIENVLATAKAQREKKELDAKVAAIMARMVDPQPSLVTASPRPVSPIADDTDLLT